MRTSYSLIALLGAALLTNACGTSTATKEGTTGPTTSGGGAGGATSAADAGGPAGMDFGPMCKDACAAPASCRGPSFSVEKCQIACARECRGEGVLDPILAIPYYQYLASKGAGWGCSLQQDDYGWDHFAQGNKVIVLKQPNMAQCTDYVVDYCVAQLMQTRDQAISTCIGQMKFGEPFKSQLAMCLTAQPNKSMDCITTAGCIGGVQTPTKEVWLGIDEPAGSP